MRRGLTRAMSSGPRAGALDLRNRCWNAARVGVLAALSWASLGCGSALAEDTLLNFFTQRSNAKPAIGLWQTTVTPTRTAAMLDAEWSSTVVATAPSNVTTGSIKKAPQHPGPRLTGQGHELSGKASYYWEDQRTATGERFDRRAMTAAHKTLPFGTRVRVTRNDTGKSVIVRINDRGPYKGGRIIDLSERAAEGLGMTGVGVAAVKLEVLGE
jgi:rare lipoprotein A